MAHVTTIDTTNKFAVGIAGDKVAILHIGKLVKGTTPDDAILLAAWLVALAQDDATHPFEEVLAAVIGL